MSDLVGNPNCWFSHAQAQIILINISHDKQHQISRDYLTFSISNLSLTVKIVDLHKTKCQNVKQYLVFFILYNTYLWLQKLSS